MLQICLCIPNKGLTFALNHSFIMKITMLILGFALIILAALLYNSGQSMAELREYKAYFWVPIAVSFLLFSYIFLHKEKV